MNPSNFAALNRRGFLQRIGSAATITSVAAAQPQTVCLVVEPDDVIATSAPARWAATTLQESLAARGVAVNRRQRITDADSGATCILAAGGTSAIAQGILNSAGAAMPAVSEALSLVQGRAAGRQVLLAAGHDPRGLAYALTELSDRVRLMDDPLAALQVSKPVSEKP